MNVFKTNNLWLVLTLCGLNLFVMHYSALFTGCVDGEMNITTIVDNIVGVCSDVIILFLLAYGITMKRLRPALVITFCITLLWSFSNVMYSRFFHSYVSLSAMGESSDGQFIYMTGLLPLRSVITVSKARSCTLPGLATALNRESRMVIPTVSSMWNQDEMCR